MRAVDAIMECLKAEGVDVVFGLPGGANLPTYDAFVDAGIRHVLVRHEAGGGHAAEGYAKATGKVGVAFGTSGPGATNLVTPIVDAMMDSVPTVFITGQVAKPASYVITGPTTVLQLIAMAGGLKDFADSKNITIVRHENGQTSSYHFNYKEIRTNLRQNIELKPGDTVVVP